MILFKILKKFILLSFLSAISLGAYSQWFSINIADSLKRNANAVLRRYNTEVRLYDESKMVITVNKVITVLNENGKDFANFNEFYDRNSHFDFIKCILYNDLGKVVKKYNTSDFADVSMSPDYTLFADNRLKYSRIISSTYPFTVEYEYRITYDNTLTIPFWYPQYSYKLAVENANLTISAVDSASFKYKSFNLNLPYFRHDDTFSKIVTWEVKNLKPFEKEPYSIGLREISPSVIIAPTHFSFESYSGSMMDWNKYGEWVSKLLEGRQDLSEVAVADIQNLTKNEITFEGKVKLVYKYLQAHSRYVSVQLGIGGFQPFRASDVEKSGYGDCKALTNYTLSLLSAIGIKSHYCEIGVNSTEIKYTDFASINQTDHVILCVPNGKDTIWLECTNQNVPFGFVSHEKLNQKVILVNGKDSKLVNMPRSNPLVDKQVRVMNVSLDTLGSAKGELFTQTFGAEMENLMPELWSNDKERLDELQKKYRVPGVKFNSYDYAVNEDDLLSASEKVSFDVLGYASRTGKRLFVPIRPFYQPVSIPAKQKTRISDLVIYEGFLHSDTTIYKLPNGYGVEFVPKPKNIKTIFGEYSLNVYEEDGKIISIRKYLLNKGLYLPEEFNNYIDFLSEIAKTDKQSIVLISKKK